MNFNIHTPSGTAEGFCLIKSLDKKITQKGMPYLDMILSDKTSEISAKLWDYNELTHGVYEVNTLVKVRGTISQYNGADQLRVEKIRAVIDSDGVKVEDFVKSSEYSPEDMYNEIISIANKFEDTDLKNLVVSIYEKYKDILLYIPAAYRLHHTMRGGLLYHTLSIIRLAESVATVYDNIDRDLLLSGAMLHDIAKVSEFVTGPTGLVDSYSVEGNLLGHIPAGAMIVETAANELDIPKEKSMLIKHMILSHHGEPEFGAAVRPMFIEAELLSQLDLMDARMFEMTEAVAAVKPGEFTSRLWALDNRKLYNHGRKTVDGKAKLL